MDGRKIASWVAAGIVFTAGVVRIHTWQTSKKPVILTGAVLRSDRDPTKQSPLANTTVSTIGGSPLETAKSDSSGLFKLAIHPGLLPGRSITLRFEHAEYQPAEINADDKNLLYVVRLEPLVRDSVVDQTESMKPVMIKNLRVRYSLKNQTTITVGSVAKQFEVVNQGDVPCRGQHPCSPDGKWKGAVGTISLDAQKGNEFRNVRASCIAGPCPFTRLQPGDLSRPSRKLEVTALDWSDTASFLVEAEVTRTMATNMVLQSYPFITGQTMTFALPGGAEGPSVVADLSGDEIVFPLGPKLLMSWALCSVEVVPAGNKIYRCELKPGYQFQQ